MCPGRALADGFWWCRCDITTVRGVGAEGMTCVTHAAENVDIGNAHGSEKKMPVGEVARRAISDTPIWGTGTLFPVGQVVLSKMWT